MRVPGAPARLPGWVGEDPELPSVISAGPWLSTPGLFFPGLGRVVAAAGRRVHEVGGRVAIHVAGP